MTKALLIIDYTNDFIADNGSLTCGKPAQDLEDYLIELADKFYENGDYVIFPTDGHTGDNLALNTSFSRHIILSALRDKNFMAN